MATSIPAQIAHIGKSVVIHGELSGSEDLFVDGNVEGNIQLNGHNLTIGPNAKVRANLTGKTVVVQGKLDGNITVTDRAELAKTAVVVGDIVAKRVAIEDGAFFKGSLEIRRDTASQSASGSSDINRASAAPQPSSSGSPQQVTKTA